MKRFYFLTIALLIYATTFGQQVTWAKSEPLLGYVTWSNGITHDQQGNTIVAGKIGQGNGIYVIKYGINGNKLWEHKYSGYKSISSICVDKENNVFVSIGQCESCTLQNDTSSYKGSVLVKYGPNGNLIWEKRGLILPQSFNTDNTAFIASGFSGSTLNLPPNINLTSNNPSFSGVIGKIKADGNYEWAIADEGSGKIHRANDSAFFITNYFNNTVTLGKGSKKVTLYENDGSKYLARYNHNGELIWAKQSKNLAGVTIDNRGSAYLLENEPYKPIFTIQKYKPNGNFEKTIIKSTFKDIHKIWLTTDKHGNIFYTGGFLENMTLGDTTLYGNVNDYTFFVAKIDSSGKLKWITTNTGIGMAGPKAISVDDDNNIYITGDMGGEVIIGGITLNEANGGIFTLKIKDLDVSPVAIKKNNAAGKSEINIYPNPSSGIITIKTISGFNNTELKIENILGQLIYSKKISTNGSQIDETINLSQYPKGIYFVQINTGSVSQVKKIVLE